MEASALMMREVLTGLGGLSLAAKKEDELEAWGAGVAAWDLWELAVGMFGLIARLVTGEEVMLNCDFTGFKVAEVWLWG